MKIKNKNRARNLRFNFVLFVLMLALLLVGCVFVYSASFYSANLIYGDKFFFLKKQILGIAVGLLGFFFFTFFDYKKLEKLKWPFLVISIILLILVFVPGIGMTNYGATRWINLRVTTLQPSEIAKFAFIVFSSSLLSKSAEKVKSLKGIIPVLIVGAIFCFLMAKFFNRVIKNPSIIILCFKTALHNAVYMSKIKCWHQNLVFGTKVYNFLVSTNLHILTHCFWT